MNYLTIGVLLLVVFCYCGGKYCPAVLKQNKQILLGVVGGLVLASFFGLKLEGAANLGKSCTLNSECNSNTCHEGNCVEPTSLDKGHHQGRARCSRDQKNACSQGGGMAAFFNTMCAPHGYQCP